MSSDSPPPAAPLTQRGRPMHTTQAGRQTQQTAQHTQQHTHRGAAAQAAAAILSLSQPTDGECGLSCSMPPPSPRKPAPRAQPDAAAAAESASIAGGALLNRAPSATNGSKAIGQGNAHSSAASKTAALSARALHSSKGQQQQSRAAASTSASAAPSLHRINQSAGGSASRSWTSSRGLAALSSSRPFALPPSSSAAASEHTLSRTRKSSDTRHERHKTLKQRSNEGEAGKRNAADRTPASASAESKGTAEGGAAASAHKPQTAKMSAPSSSSSSSAAAASSHRQFHSPSARPRLFADSERCDEESDEDLFESPDPNARDDSPSGGDDDSLMDDAAAEDGGAAASSHEAARSSTAASSALAQSMSSDSDDATCAPPGRPIRSHERPSGRSLPDFYIDPLSGERVDRPTRKSTETSREFNARYQSWHSKGKAVWTTAELVQAKKQRRKQKRKGAQKNTHQSDEETQEETLAASSAAAASGAGARSAASSRRLSAASVAKEGDRTGSDSASAAAADSSNDDSDGDGGSDSSSGYEYIPPRPTLISCRENPTKFAAELAEWESLYGDHPDAEPEEQPLDRSQRAAKRGKSYSVVKRRVHRSVDHEESQGQCVRVKRPPGWRKPNFYIDDSGQRIERPIREDGESDTEYKRRYNPWLKALHKREQGSTKEAASSGAANDAAAPTKSAAGDPSQTAAISAAAAAPSAPAASNLPQFCLSNGPSDLMSLLQLGQFVASFTASQAAAGGAGPAVPSFTIQLQAPTPAATAAFVPQIPSAVAADAAMRDAIESDNTGASSMPALDFASSAQSSRLQRVSQPAFTGGGAASSLAAPPVDASAAGSVANGKRKAHSDDRLSHADGSGAGSETAAAAAAAPSSDSTPASKKHRRDAPASVSLSTQDSSMQLDSDGEGENGSDASALFAPVQTDRGDDGAGHSEASAGGAAADAASSSGASTHANKSRHAVIPPRAPMTQAGFAAGGHPHIQRKSQSAASISSTRQPVAASAVESGGRCRAPQSAASSSRSAIDNSFLLERLDETSTLELIVAECIPDPAKHDACLAALIDGDITLDVLERDFTVHFPRVGAPPMVQWGLITAGPAAKLQSIIRQRIELKQRLDNDCIELKREARAAGK